MNRWMGMLMVAALLMSGCSSLHDGEGWEHEGDPETHSDSKPYLFEHKH